MKSKAWDWSKVVGDVNKNIWLEPSIESYYLIDRWKKQNKKEFLDLGCGLGRHTIQFAKAEFNTCSMDLSMTSINETKKWCKKENLDVGFSMGDMLKLPYGDEKFDCVLGYSVIYHTNTNGMKQVISEMYRILKEGGEAYLTLASKYTWHGKQNKLSAVDKNTKIKLETSGEKGVPHFFADYNLIYELFSDFKIEDILHIQRNDKYGEKGSWHYHMLIRKTRK